MYRIFVVPLAKFICTLKNADVKSEIGTVNSEIFCEGFMKIKSSQNSEITLSFTDLGKPCPSREILTSKIWLLMFFAKIRFTQTIPNLQYLSFLLDLHVPDKTHIYM